MSRWSPYFAALGAVVCAIAFGLGSGAADAQNPPPPGATVAVVTPVPLASIPAALTDAIKTYAVSRFSEPYIGDCSQAVTANGVKWCSGVTHLTSASAVVSFAHAFSDYGVPAVTFRQQPIGAWLADPLAPAAGSGTAAEHDSRAGIVIALAGGVAVALGAAGFARHLTSRPPGES